MSIVTPSFNQGRYLRTAIESVLTQDYPRIECLVVDGGSSDDSLEILASYGDRVSWLSEPDGGQADAINKGFRRTRGSILGWLNSDDTYSPGAITEVVRAFESREDVGLVYGTGSILDEAGNVVRRFEEIEPFSLWRLMYSLDYILQPAAFFRRRALFDVGLLDQRLDFALDWDLWIRLAARHEVCFLDRHLACSRVYGNSKTSTGGWRRIRELGRLTRMHTGTFWTPGVGLYALDALGQRLCRWRPLCRLVNGVEGRLSRRITEHMPLHPDGWLGPRGKLVVPRRWRRATLMLEAHRLPSGDSLVVDISAEGRQLARAVAERPGPFEIRLGLPDGDRPFVELDVSTNFSFRAPPDRRRLAVRCVELRRWPEESERS